MTPSDREILERAVTTISEQAAKTIVLIDNAMDAGLAADHPVTVAAKMLRLELLKTKAELERGLIEFVLDCTACGMEVHWVQGISISDPGHWGTDTQRRTASRWSRPPDLRWLTVCPRCESPQARHLARSVAKSQTPGVIPETRYAKTADGVHIAYQVRGDGPVDLVYVTGFASCFEVELEESRTVRFIRRTLVIRATGPVRQAGHWAFRPKADTGS